MRKNSPLINIYCKIFCAFAMLLSSFQIAAQCPTVTQSTQSFCDVESSLVGDLIATDNGGGIVWYATATSTTPLGSNIELVNGEDYYADDNTGSCESRERVDVVIYGPPVGLNFQGVCSGENTDITLAALEAEGNDVKWYTSATGGSPLPLTTVIESSMIYYADQANPDTGCRTSRLAVFVNISVVAAPEGEEFQNFCNDPDSPPVVGDLDATGNNNWYATSYSVVPLDPSTPLIDGEDYYASKIEPPCESVERLKVVVDLQPVNNSGNSGSLDICISELETTGTINLFDILQGNPESIGVWEGPLSITNGSVGTIDPSGMTVADSPYTFTYTVDKPDTECPASSTTVSVSIVPLVNAGENGTLALCDIAPPQDLFSRLGGEPDAGGVWTPTLSSGSGIFDPAVDAAGIYTYTVSGQLPCSDDTATVTVTINTAPDPGTDGAVTLCTVDDPVDLFGLLGGSPETGGTWSPQLSGGGSIFDPAVDEGGVYSYTLTSGDACGEVSASVTVTLIPDPNAGTNANIIVCADNGPVDLFEYIGGSPDAGGVWNPALSGGNGIFDPNLDTDGTYTYTVTGSAQCGLTDSSQITVTIEANPVITGAVITVGDICLGESTVAMISGADQLTSGDYQITYTLLGANNSETTTTVTFANGSGEFTIESSDLSNEGSTTIVIDQLSRAVSGCDADVSVVPSGSFTIESSPEPQLVESGATFCGSDAPTIADLGGNLTGVESYVWYDNETGGTPYDPSDLLVDGQTYYATGVNASGCESVTRLAVTVEFEVCESDLLIPDGFSPNGDGINDTFKINNLRELYPSFTLEIFNRYGNVLYEGNQGTPDWDGNAQKGATIGSNTLPVGVYFFILNFNDGSREPLQGRVYLNR
ncbi:gliding motility-associated C-terminal domain-containing protein [Robertkochia solimangrovi]|uniref:gliding motility-associated C-terminal domain-containing protein n=1 Tax=Robertkochia solimangrovi TaxID=2213046 RepID=UPI00117DC4D9|nr:gliding motility-associated C-terminal domain-containing protein [Robertkochia solimangrovi]TRZ42001.1 hypothetical protein DMZ48_15300 [Robertkochia solimangrovi]